MTRPVDDHYPTPPEVTRLLLMAETFDGGIWEPCAGDGSMSDVLKEKHEVIATTLNDGTGDVIGGRDFLKEIRLLAPNIVTNPPYRIANDVVGRALTLRPRKMAMLLNLKFLASEKRRRFIFSNAPPDRLIVISNRVSFYPVDWSGSRGTTTETYAWFVWGKDDNIPALRWGNTRTMEITQRVDDRCVVSAPGTA